MHLITTTQRAPLSIRIVTPGFDQVDLPVCALLPPAMPEGFGPPGANPNPSDLRTKTQITPHNSEKPFVGYTYVR